LSDYSISGIESLFWYGNRNGLFEGNEKLLAEDFASFSLECSSDMLLHRFNDVIDVLGIRVLGISMPLDFQDFLNLAIKDAKAYWGEARYENEREGSWLQIIQQPWLCSLIAGDEDCLKLICRWMTPERNCEFAGKQDYAIVPLLNGMSRLVAEPFSDEQQRLLETQLKTATTKHVKQLIASYRALIARNEKNFHKEFIAGLALFAKSTTSGIAKKEVFIDRRPYRLFSLTHSIQWCLAKRIQMTLPSLPKELMSHLIVPETLGLA
jgi:hypothetical protein